MVCKYLCVCVTRMCVKLSALSLLIFLGATVTVCSVSVYLSACISLFVRVCLRAHAGDGSGFLEDGLAGELGLYRHGYKSGGSRKGEFISPSY